MRLCTCGRRVPVGRRCPTCDTKRGTRTARGYSNRWLKFRAQWLAALDIEDHEQRMRTILQRMQCADPFGIHGQVIVRAAIVDHIVPHGGNPKLMWDAANLQSLCWSCHSRKTRREQTRKRP